MKITVVGTGYVGFSLSVLLAQRFHVIALDIDEKKISLINQRKSIFKDTEIEKFLSSKNLRLNATQDKNEAYKDAEFIIIATPTNYDEESGSFDTTSVESVIDDIQNINEKANIVIKSTIPFGFTDSCRQFYKNDNIFYSPEFLRENNALSDNLYPSRIIVGDTTKKAENFARILAECSLKKYEEIPILLMQSKEAEAVKLFSNTYLAMRISFFNELDTFSEKNSLSTKRIIDGICEDHRIGSYYNNPSFGYGGYCLPKDTKQLLKNYDKIPNELIKAIVASNETRKNFIADNIINKAPKIVGVYRLVMKKESLNFRESAVIDIIKIIQNHDIKVVLYEPLNQQVDLDGVEIIDSLDEFIDTSEIIIANRLSDELDKVKHKVYSRDLFNNN